MSVPGAGCRVHTVMIVTMWILKSVEPLPDEGEVVFRVTPGSIKTLGRAARADFVLDVPLVSRFHCRFTASHEGGLLLEDLGSTNGTFVNDKRIERVTLTQGDRVRIGRVELGVERGAAR
jgi:pSer/pThr/pTyr-binding forkhead associated (FHA) protein